MSLGLIHTKDCLAAYPVVFLKSICIDLQGIADRAVHCRGPRHR
jgi:hypothetical protein